MKSMILLTQKQKKIVIALKNNHYEESDCSFIYKYTSEMNKKDWLKI